MTTSLRITLIFTCLTALALGATIAAPTASADKPSQVVSRIVMKSFAGKGARIKERKTSDPNSRVYRAELAPGPYLPATANPSLGIIGFFSGQYAIISFYSKSQHLFSRGGELTSLTSFDNFSWVNPDGEAISPFDPAVIDYYNRVFNLRPAKLGSFTSTAYGPPWGGIEGGLPGQNCSATATGMQLCKGQQVLAVAVDPQLIPYGSKLKIAPNPFGDPNLVFTAVDTGGALINKRIDFFIASGREEQNKWGRKRVRVTVVGRGAPDQADGLNRIN